LGLCSEIARIFCGQTVEETFTNLDARRVEMPTAAATPPPTMSALTTEFLKPIGFDYDFRLMALTSLAFAFFVEESLRNFSVDVCVMLFRELSSDVL